jgi:hypothetical protein
MAGTKFSLIEQADIQRYRFRAEPALTFVPDDLSSQKGCVFVKQRKNIP